MENEDDRVHLLKQGGTVVVRFLDDRSALRREFAVRTKVVETATEIVWAVQSLALVIEEKGRNGIVVVYEFDASAASRELFATVCAALIANAVTVTIPKAGNEGGGAPLMPLLHPRQPVERKAANPLPVGYRLPGKWKV